MATRGKRLVQSAKLADIKNNRPWRVKHRRKVVAELGDYDYMYDAPKIRRGFRKSKVRGVPIG